MSQVSAVASPSTGWIASSTPAAVATPLPPWKRKNTGYRWPRNTASAAHATPISPPMPKCRTSQTASQPLKASPTSVRIAAFLLPLRSTLVAPGFFDPYERGSASPMVALTTTANEIDPIR